MGVRVRYQVPSEGVFPCPELLLHPNIPKPLHGLSPRTIFGSVWWDVVRNASYAEHNFCCHACGIPKHEAKYHQWLEAHECYNINYKTGEVRFIRIVALCHSCHNYIHSGRMRMIIGTEEMPKEKYYDILRHGNKLLKDNKIRHIKYKTSTEWEDWHLTINEARYERAFNTYKDWLNRYHQ